MKFKFIYYPLALASFIVRIYVWLKICSDHYIWFNSFFFFLIISVLNISNRQHNATYCACRCPRGMRCRTRNSGCNEAFELRVEGWLLCVDWHTLRGSSLVATAGPSCSSWRCCCFSRPFPPLLFFAIFCFASPPIITIANNCALI